AVARKSPARKTAARKSPAKKTARKTARKGAGATASRGNSAAKKTTKIARTRKTAASKRSGRKTAAKSRRGITPKQALENTRKLLEAKQEHDRQPQPWQQLDGGHDVNAHGGYQSDEAAAKAAELHAAESRLQATQGSIGTQGRHDQ